MEETQQSILNLNLVCLFYYFEASATQRQTQYFVYCKTCKDITPGKLRVCCSRCSEGAMVLYQVVNNYCGKNNHYNYRYISSHWRAVILGLRLHVQCM